MCNTDRIETTTVAGEDKLNPSICQSIVVDPTQHCLILCKHTLVQIVIGLTGGRCMNIKIHTSTVDVYQNYSIYQQFAFSHDTGQY